MHPLARSDLLEICPKCGSSYQPREAHLAQIDLPPRLTKIRWRWPAAPTFALITLAIADRLPGRPLVGGLAPHTLALIELLLATPVCLVAAWPLYRLALESMKNANPDLSTLIGLGVFASYWYSVVATFWPNSFPDTYRVDGAGIGRYFMVSSAFVVMWRLGRALESRIGDATESSTEHCNSLAARRGNLRQKLTDHASGAFLAIVWGVGATAFSAWYFLGPEPRFASSVASAAAILIAASPCALALAAPLSTFVAFVKGSRIGVSFESAGAIESLRDIDTLVVGRSGTLTSGTPKLVAVLPFSGYDEETLFRYAASLESGCKHILATAIVDESTVRGISLGATTAFEAFPGKGVRGIVDGHAVTVGNLSMMVHHGFLLGEMGQRAETLRAEGLTSVYVAIDDHAAGLLCLHDATIENAPAAIRALHKEGLRVVLLTGESRTAAEELAVRLDIDEVIAETPRDRQPEAIRLLRKNGRRVGAFAPDDRFAANRSRQRVWVSESMDLDSPLVAAATIWTGDLHGMARARKLSTETIRNIQQSLSLLFLCSAAGIAIASGAFYPDFGIVFSPGIATTLMGLGLVGLAANTLRLKRSPL